MTVLAFNASTGSKMQESNISPHFTLEEGRRVLNLEESALHALSASMDENFLKACQIIIETQGRVVISGMEQSGHIGRKIATQLSSPGKHNLLFTPAEDTN